MINRLISIAPMMGCTDRHFRQLIRLISERVMLYTEMVTTWALLKGHKFELLTFGKEEHPIGLQLGGSVPDDLADCAKMGEALGYDEINVNVGCPSSRVSAGQFGACLMKSPELVADCVDRMRNAVRIPITVKTRIGVDDYDHYEALHHFVKTVSAAGCGVFIIHARKAWLKGLSPRENRHVPPLCYSTVYRLKQDFPQLEIIINGGITTRGQIDTHLNFVDGVMVGREAYRNPLLLESFDQIYFHDEQSAVSPHFIVQRYLPYIAQQTHAGIKIHHLVRHLHGMFSGYRGARLWRRHLTEHVHQPRAGISVIEEALRYVLPMTVASVSPANRGTQN